MEKLKLKEIIDHKEKEKEIENNEIKCNRLKQKIMAVINSDSVNFEKYIKKDLKRCLQTTICVYLEFSKDHKLNSSDVDSIIDRVYSVFVEPEYRLANMYANKKS